MYKKGQGRRSAREHRLHTADTGRVAHFCAYVKKLQMKKISKVFQNFHELKSASFSNSSAAYAFSSAILEAN